MFTVDVKQQQPLVDAMSPLGTSLGSFNRIYNKYRGVEIYTNPGTAGSFPSFSSLSDETLNLPLNTGWERTGHMLCIMDTSLSVSMTLRMCLRELCCLFEIFYCLDLNHLVRVFYLFMFS